MTERKRAEHEAQQQRRELAHLSRVASLGELSGALAHEVSQPLAAILANAQAAQRLLSREPNPRRKSVRFSRTSFTTISGLDRSFIA